MAQGFTFWGMPSRACPRMALRPDLVRTVSLLVWTSAFKPITAQGGARSGPWLGADQKVAPSLVGASGLDPLSGQL